MNAHTSIVMASTAQHESDIKALRRSIYVEDQGRLASEADMSDSFDRYNDQATYFLCYVDGEPVAAIKAIHDGALGLPCEYRADISQYREKGAVVEFGHLITRKENRKKGYGLLLMKAALDYTYFDLDGKFIFGDFFVQEEQGPGFHHFYIEIGFAPASTIYKDDRFLDAPESIVGVLDIDKAILGAANPGASELNLYFFASLAKMEQKHAG